MIIECRNVTCLCDSCLLEENSQCPNVECVDKYQSFDLQKVELEHLHWNLDMAARMNETDADMELDDPPVFEIQENNFNSNTAHVAFLAFYYKVQECQTYTDLKNVTMATDISCFDAVSMNIQSLQCYDVIDPAATLYLPRDTPKGYIPVSIYGDGNCFQRAVSKEIYGSEEFLKEIRM